MEATFTEGRLSNIARGTPETQLVLDLQEMGRSGGEQLQGNVLKYSEDILLLGEGLRLLWLQGCSITFVGSVIHVKEVVRDARADR